MSLESRNAYPKAVLRTLDEVGEEMTVRRSRRDKRAEQEHGEGEASKLIQAALDQLGVSEKNLAAMRKGDSVKLAVTALVRRRTTVSNPRLAEKLVLGHMNRVSHICASF